MDPTAVLVGIPTYNERDNIQVLLDLFREVGGNFHLLFVDDNSPDGTAALIESLQPQWPNLFLLKRPGKMGIGSAHRDALGYAYEHGYSLCATMDADLTHSPESLARMLEYAQYADIVVGSRYLLSRSLPGWNLFRKALTHTGHFVTSFFLKMPYDATGGLRIYNLKAIPQPLFGLVRSSGYSFLYESLFILWTNGCQVVEVPIELPARTYGSSKMSWEQMFISILRLVLLYTNIRVAPDLYRLKRVPGSEDAHPATSSWDRYWGGAGRDGAADILFEVCATWFRMAFNKPFLERVMRRFFQKGERVLHAGCGSGQVDQTLRHLLKITACDISADAVRMYAQVNWPHCECRQADIMALPYEDGEFDGVYNLGVMEHFSPDEIRTAFREFYRILRPGGRVVIFWPPLKSPLRYVLGVFHFFARRLDTKAKEPPYPPEISRVASRQQGESWLREAGFEPLYCEFSGRDLYTQYAFVAQKPGSAALAKEPS
jgi:dolichol-phosphate mannosyltransferase